MFNIHLFRNSVSRSVFPISLNNVQCNKHVKGIIRLSNFPNIAHEWLMSDQMYVCFGSIFPKKQCSFPKRCNDPHGFVRALLSFLSKTLT